jgi:hypothetical protein
MDPEGRSWPEGSVSPAGRIAPLWPLLAMLRIQNDFYNITVPSINKLLKTFIIPLRCPTAAIFTPKLHNFTSQAAI